MTARPPPSIRDYELRDAVASQPGGRGPTASQGFQYPSWSGYGQRRACQARSPYHNSHRDPLPSSCGGFVLSISAPVILPEVSSVQPRWVCFVDFRPRDSPGSLFRPAAVGLFRRFPRLRFGATSADHSSGQVARSGEHATPRGAVRRIEPPGKLGSFVVFTIAPCRYNPFSDRGVRRSEIGFVRPVFSRILVHGWPASRQPLPRSDCRIDKERPEAHTTICIRHVWQKSTRREFFARPRAPCQPAFLSLSLRSRRRIRLTSIGDRQELLHPVVVGFLLFWSFRNVLMSCPCALLFLLSSLWFCLQSVAAPGPVGPEPGRELSSSSF